CTQNQSPDRALNRRSGSSPAGGGSSSRNSGSGEPASRCAAVVLFPVGRLRAVIPTLPSQDQFTGALSPRPEFRGISIQDLDPIAGGMPISGGPGWIRTNDQGIMSPLL